jgi:hypothetical protein
MDAASVVERVVTVVMDKLHPPVSITKSVDSFAHLIAMHDQARISGDHVTEQYATAMLQKLANDATLLIDWTTALLLDLFMIHNRFINLFVLDTNYYKNIYT